MPEIKILPKSISDLIAAGEVVERPASVIKELLENSIDAGATTITVEIMNGGIKFMRVTDNGCGIERNEIKNIFRPLYSKKSSSNNFGIGLSSALKTITYHSGTILCKSKPGEYTVFQVILPVLKL